MATAMELPYPISAPRPIKMKLIRYLMPISSKKDIVKISPIYGALLLRRLLHSGFLIQFFFDLNNVSRRDLRGGLLPRHGLRRSWNISLAYSGIVPLRHKQCSGGLQLIYSIEMW
jgi:hypothetical protein